MPLIKVKIYDMLHKTEKATLFLTKYEKQTWLPNFKFKYTQKGNYILIEEEFAIEKKLEYSNYIHVPSVIEPIRNQKPIDELIYEAN